jgi:hypothetical protein
MTSCVSVSSSYDATNPGWCNVKTSLDAAFMMVVLNQCRSVCEAVLDSPDLHQGVHFGYPTCCIKAFVLKFVVHFNGCYLSSLDRNHLLRLHGCGDNEKAVSRSILKSLGGMSSKIADVGNQLVWNDVDEIPEWYKNFFQNTSFTPCRNHYNMIIEAHKKLEFSGLVNMVREIESKRQCKNSFVPGDEDLLKPNPCDYCKQYEKS